MILSLLKQYRYQRNTAGACFEMKKCHNSSLFFVSLDQCATRCAAASSVYLKDAALRILKASL